MKLVKFEKWFFDILTPQNGYIVFFHTVTRFLFFKFSYLDISIHNKNQKYTGSFKIFPKHIDKHNILLKEGSITFEKDRCKYSIKNNELEINLEITSTDKENLKWPVMTIGKNGKHQIDWSPLLLKANFNGSIKTDTAVSIVNNIGYIDYVRSNFLPFKMPVVELYWGRLHHKELCLSYSFAWTKIDQAPICQIILKKGNDSFCFERCSIEVGNYIYSEEISLDVPQKYTIQGTRKNGFIKIEVEHIEPAILLQFASHKGFFEKIKNQVFNWLIREPAGIKFHAIAKVEFIHNKEVTVIENIRMISEYVVFLYSKKKSHE